jgi:hypothetical protein
MSSKRAGRPQEPFHSPTLCPHCASRVEQKEYGITYCRRCRLVEKPPNLLDQFGVTVEEVHTTDPNVEPFQIIHLFDPAILKLARPSAMVNIEERGKGTPSDPTPSNAQSNPAIETQGGGGLDSLPPARAKAYSQFRWAIDSNPEFGTKTTDREAYDWLEEYLEKDELPTFETWSRYLRQARNRLGQLKNRPRRGRTGRSVARGDQL